MLNRTKFVILLAAYNGMNWLDEQLQSVLSQRDVDLAIYISVDMSTDNTLQWCHDIEENDDRVTVLKSTERFGGAAKNFYHLIHEVDFSSYDYIAFADQDDIWNNDKLSRAVSQLSATNADGYSSNVTAFWENGKTRLINKAQPQVRWDYLFESAGPGCTFVLSKHVALDLQDFVQVHSEEMKTIWLHDWFTYAFARARGYRWIIDSQPTMQYRQHANNQVGVNSGFKAFKHRAIFVLSGKGMIQSALLAKLVGQADTDFVKSWLPFGRLGFFKLAFRANVCRRKRSERLLFMFACLLLATIGVSSINENIDEH